MEQDPNQESSGTDRRIRIRNKTIRIRNNDHHSCTSAFFFLNIFLGDFFFFCSYNIQHCFICRPSDSTVPTDAGIEPRTVATGALAVRRSNHQAGSHPHQAGSHPHFRLPPHAITNFYQKQNSQKWKKIKILSFFMSIRQLRSFHLDSATSR